MRKKLPDVSYFALIHREATRPIADAWPIDLPERLPSIPVPLLAPDDDAILNLQAAFTGAFDSVGYGRAIDYGSPLSPPPADRHAPWINSIISGR